MVNFSPDGGRAVTASEDKTAIVWDAVAGRMFARLCGHEGQVTFACFSPDGSRVATGGRDSRVMLWDSQTGEVLHCLQVHDGDIWAPRLASRAEAAQQSVAHAKPADWRTPPRAGFIKNLRFYDHPYVHFSPDSTRLVTVCLGVAKVWDVRTGNALFELLGHRGWIMSARFSPDGRSILTGSMDHTAALWDASSGEKQLTLSGHEGWVRCARFSPDGQHILSLSDDQSAMVWDRQSGRAVLRLGKLHDQPRWAQISQDGRKAVFIGGLDERVDIWDLTSGSKISTLEGHQDRVTSVDFHPDGQHIVTGSDDNSAIVWECQSGRVVRKLVGHTSAVNFVRFSPEGSRMATASSDTTTVIWDTESGRRVSVFLGRHWPVRAACLSSDGRRFLCSGQFEERLWLRRIAGGLPLAHGITARGDKAIVWDLPSGKKLQALPGRISQASFSPDGRWVVTTVNSEIAVLWNAQSGDERWSVKQRGPMHYALFSPNGRMVVTYARGYKDATVWEAESARELLALRDGSRTIEAVYFSPDSQLLVTAFQADGAVVWHVPSGKKLAALREQELFLTENCFTPDGRLIVAAANSIASVVVWDLSENIGSAARPGAASLLNPTLLWSEPKAKSLHVWAVNAPLGSTRFSADGRRVLAMAGGKECLVWDVLSGERLTVLGGQPGQLRDAVFSVDGSKILGISSGPTEEMATLWDVESGQSVATLRGHENAIHWAQFTPDGRYILTASEDGSVRLWDAFNGDEIVQLWNVPGLCWLAATPDGYFDGPTEVFGSVRHRDSTGEYIEFHESLKYHRPNLVGQLLGTSNA